MTTSRTFRVLAALTVVLALAACGGSNEGSAAASDAGDTPAGPSTVTIDDQAYSPADLTVAPGTTVNWINDDDAPHTVTFDSDTVDSSEQMETGDSFATTFEQTGTYDYICAIHPDMTATVTVS